MNNNELQKSSIWKKMENIINYFLNKTECADFAHPVDYVIKQIK